MTTILLIGAAALAVYALSSGKDDKLKQYMQQYSESVDPDTDPEPNADEPLSTEPADVPTAPKTPAEPVKTAREKAIDALYNSFGIQGFTAIIDGYTISEKYADCRYYMQFFKGKGNLGEVVVKIKSVYTTFLGYAQEAKVNDILYPTYVVPNDAKRTNWVCVTELFDGVWKPNTWGAYVYAKHGYDSKGLAYPCTAYITYEVSYLEHPEYSIERTISIKGQVILYPFGSGLHNDVLLNNREDKTGEKLTTKINKYIAKGRPSDYLLIES